MDSSLIPADDPGVWDELYNEQSREIRQHLQQNNPEPPGFLLQTVESIKSAAVSASQRWYRPVPTSAATGGNSPHATTRPLADFGLEDYEYSEDDEGYHEFGSSSTPLRNAGSFVFLQPFTRFAANRREEWGAVSNLDLFFTSLYNYYYHRGMGPIIGRGIADLISLFVTLWLSVVLFAYVDWNELVKCHDEQTCKPYFSDYLTQRPFSKWWSAWNLVVILYILLFSAYSLFSLWSFWQTLSDAYSAQQFFQERLGISEQRLEGGAIDWDQHVVTKLMELQQQGMYRIAINAGELNALTIAQRIMRKENYLVGFFNRGLLDLHVPFLDKNRLFFCKSLEWSIHFCILNYMYNHKYEVRPAFYLDPAALKRRLFLCGILHAIFLPFLAFFMVLHFLMTNVYDWKATQNYLGPKQWSLAAKWTFREFNELPHLFERRLGPSYAATEEYLKLFTQSQFMTTIGRILAFCGGSFGAVLLVFAALNDAILLHVKIGNFNLLYFVGIMGVVYSAGKSMLPDPEIHSRYIRNLYKEMDEALANIAVHTHHFPDGWKGKGNDKRVKSIISSMFNHKAGIFVTELISLLLAPIILCYSLPLCAEHVCEFVMTTKASVQGSGDVCGYSTFDFDQFQDESFTGKTMHETRGHVAASVAELHNVEAAMRGHERPKTFHGKMEKSFFSFKSTHANWKSTKSGQTLLDRVERFKQNETRVLAMEQQQHLQAAARQLVTLATLEQQQQPSDQQQPTLARIHESYIQQQPTSGADSGGGGHAALPSDQPVQPLISSVSRTGLAGETLPPFAQLDAHAASLQNPAALSVPHFADLGLSTELRRMLNNSNSSSTTAEEGGTAASVLWLSRYHAHVADTEQQQRDHQNRESAPMGSSRPTDPRDQNGQQHQTDN